VGAGKTERCKESYSVEINGTLKETIGGNLLMTADEHFMDGADQRSTWAIAGAVTGATKTLHIEAKKRIVLQSGASTVVLSASGVTIRAARYQLDDAASLVTLTQRIQHNG
jgi:hypothetical protein